jgi:MYXO-CTERM domain-containing protein
MAQTVEVSLSEAVGPWQDGLIFETLVDGQRYDPDAHLKYTAHYGESWVGRGKDLLATLCDMPPEGWDDEYWYAPDESEIDEFLSPGTHQVQLVATVVGTDVRLQSPVKTFTLDDCAERPDAGNADSDSKPVVDVDGGGTASQTDDDTEATDTEATDAGNPRPSQLEPDDAGTPSDDSSPSRDDRDAAVLDRGTQTRAVTDKSGSGCSVAPSGTGSTRAASALAWGLLSLAAALTRRRSRLLSSSR